MPIVTDGSVFVVFTQMSLKFTIAQLIIGLVSWLVGALSPVNHEGLYQG